MGLENIQEAIEISRQGAKLDYPEWLHGEPKNILNYIDLILDQESKLSSIITCFMCFNPELDIPMNFAAFGSALEEYIKKIKKYTEGLHEHLKKIEAYKFEEARQG